MMSSMLVMAVLAGAPVTLQYEGTLQDALKELAQKSQLNVVVLGDLNERAQLNLSGVDGEDALTTIAEAYDLEIKKSEKSKQPLWIIRRAGAVAAAVTPPAVPLPAIAPIPPVAPVPPVPPVAPVALNDGTAETLRAEAETARKSAEQLIAETERAQEKLDSLINASQDAREAAREAYEEARERAEEAAEEAREKAQAAADLAREQAQDVAEAKQERAEALREEAQARAELEESRAELQRHRVSTGAPVTVEKGSRIDTAVAYGGPVIIEEGAVVTGDAVAFGGDVVLRDGAVVEGDAVSFGGTVVRGSGAQVHGETVSMGGSGFGQTMARNMVKTQRTVKQLEHAEEDGDESGFGLARFLLEFAALFGIGFVMMMFAPNRMKAMEATVKAEPGKNALAGVLGVLAIGPVTALLCVTLVGIPVALLLWMAAALALPVGLAVMANVLGARLPTGKLRKTQALVLALGLLALLVAFEIPVLGVLAAIAVISMSLGAIIRTRFGQPPKGTPMVDVMSAAPVL